MKYFVYILKSAKLSRFYTGSTSNLDVRLVFLKNAESSKFTAKAKDWEIYLKMEFESKAQALGIEHHIKFMKSNPYIQNLKLYTEMVEKLLMKYT